MLSRSLIMVSLLTLCTACAGLSPEVSLPPPSETLVSHCEYLASPDLERRVKLAGTFSEFDEVGLRGLLAPLVPFGTSAWTAIKFEIGIDGAVSNVRVDTSSAPDAFERAVLMFFEAARATPTMLDGSSIAYPFGCSVIRLESIGP